MAQWAGLLKWSLAYHDGTRSASDFKPLSEEDRNFLEKVMDEMVVDEVKRMRIILEILKWPEDPHKLRELLQQSEDMSLRRPMADEGKKHQESKDEKKAESIPESDEELIDMLVSKKEEALEELDERVLTLDHSMDFTKIGGMPILLSLIQHTKHRSLTVAAAQALSTVVSNNPDTQKVAMEHKALDVLLPLLSTTNHKSVIAKGLTAVGALVRNHPQGEQAFMEAAGPAQLSKLLSFEDKRVVTKALNLIKHLAHSDGTKAGIVQFVLDNQLLLLFPGMLNRTTTEDDREDSNDLNMRDAQIETLAALLKHEAVLSVAKKSSELQQAVVRRLSALRSLYVSAEDVDMVQSQLEGLMAVEHSLGLKSSLSSGQKDHQKLEAKRKAEEEKRRQLEAEHRRKVNEAERKEREAQDKARKNKG